jgi:DNA replication protein DnaC
MSQDLEHVETVDAVCKDHGPYRSEVFGQGIAMVKESCPKCLAEFQSKKVNAEAQETERRWRDRVARLTKSSEIPARFRDASLDTYQAKSKAQTRALQTARRFAANFAEIAKRGSFLTLVGSLGTGKTFLACAIGNALLAKGYGVLYVTAYKLLREIKRSWARNAEMDEKAVMARYTGGCDLLILDEIGVQYGTDAERVLLFQVIDDRYSELLPTVLVSNLDREGLANVLGERAFDRLAEYGSAIVAFEWESFRPQHCCSLQMDASFESETKDET